MVAELLPSLRSTILAVAAAVCFLGSGCDGSSGSMEFVAKRASFGKWEDKRDTGSIIMHDMLIVEEPRAYGPRGGPLGFYVITTQGRMASKLDDIVSDRIPTNRGVKMNFAVGNTIPVRIEKVLDGGERQLIHEGRAAFLEVTR